MIDKNLVLIFCGLVLFAAATIASAYWFPSDRDLRHDLGMITASFSAALFTYLKDHAK